jgi:hypothetical protein
VQNSKRLLLWLAPLLLYSEDALAWGLYTHVYFAQLLLWAVPLLDPGLQQAIRRFPRLVMAGACLPDLFLVGKTMWHNPFTDAHSWGSAKMLLENASGDKDTAIAAGYVSHLLVDIFAHNHFVPAHEVLWQGSSFTTHVISEWAMDAHIQSHAFLSPRELINEECVSLLPTVEQHFGCSEAVAKRCLYLLAQGDRVLRSSRVPQFLYRLKRKRDMRLKARFNYYISETASRLCNINRVFAGEDPAWYAEPQSNPLWSTHRSFPIHELRRGLTFPQDVF